MIRLILDILRPDSGEIEVLGKPFSEATKDTIGYLPEEGGLYKKEKVFDCIRYFAQLKGAKDIDRKAEEWLKKMDLRDYARRNVQELSKGMHRKLQFILAVIHDPAILIVDEPFYGLDPVNRNLIKDILLELKGKGVTILLSTHQMDEVEKMCDRILMIHRGQKMLYGDLSQIKSEYGLSIVLEYEGTLPALGGIQKTNDYGNYAELNLEINANPQGILEALVKAVKVKKFEVKTVSMNEIFIDVVQRGQ